MKWQAQTAKAKFSALLRAAREKGPQTITVHGKEEFVLLTRAAYQKRQAGAPPADWDAFFAPVRGLGDDLALPPRVASPMRPLDFGDEPA